MDVELETVWSGSIERQAVVSKQTEPRLEPPRPVQAWRRDPKPGCSRRDRLLAIMRPTPERLWTYSELAAADKTSTHCIRKVVSDMQRDGQVEVLRNKRASERGTYARVKLKV